MAEPKNEQLSALADGELPEHELNRSIDRMSGDRALRERLGRYYLIGDVMNHRRTVGGADHLCDRVSEALADEPPILAPRRGARKPMRPFFRRAAGAAMAASVTAVAILGVQELSDAPTVEGRVAETADVSGSRPTAPGPGSIVARGEPDPEMRSRLNPYLVDHHEYSASTRMQGILPYARVVSHSSR